MVQVRIVPDAEPNADSVLHEIDEVDSLAGTWTEVTARLAPFIPTGWHIVRLGNDGEQS